MTDVNFDFETMMKFVNIHISRNRDSLSIQDTTIKFLEDVFFLYLDLKKCETFNDLRIAGMRFWKMRLGTKSLYKELVEKLDFLISSFSSAFTQSSHVASLRSLLNEYGTFIKSELYHKFLRIITYLLTTTAAKHFGLSLKLFNYSDMEIEVYERCNSLSPNLLYTICDTVIFILERIEKFLITKDYKQLLYSEDKFDSYKERFEKIKLESEFLCNPGPLNFSWQSYAKDLKLLIDEIKVEYDKAKAIKSKDKKWFAEKYYDLLKYQSELTVKIGLSEDRCPPYFVNIYGDSSIGKSTLAKIFFIHAAKVYDLPYGSQYRYVRTFDSDHWDGFTSDKWYIHVDDLCHVHPNVSSASGGNKQLLEVLNVKNPTSYTPPMADLKDKGKSPILAWLLTASTNVEDLHAPIFFSCPIAILRRIDFYVKPIVKPEFRSQIGGLDVKGEFQDGYPNYWNFQIYRVEAIHPNAKPELKGARFVEDKYFTDINEMLDYYSELLIKHRTIHTKIEETTDTMVQVPICKLCKRLKCICLNNQNGYIEIADFVSCGVIMYYLQDVINFLYYYAKNLISYMSTTIGFRNIIYRYVRNRLLIYYILWYIGILDYIKPPNSSSVITEYWSKNKNMLSHYYKNRTKPILISSLIMLFSIVLIYVKRNSNKLFKNMLDPYAWYLYDSASKTVSQISEPKHNSHSIIFSNYEDCEKYITSRSTNSHICSTLQGYVVRAVTQSLLDIGDKPIATDKEHTNVWINDKEIINSSYFGTSTLSSVGNTQASYDRIIKNLITLRITHNKIPQGKQVLNSALCLGGTLYISNNHAFDTTVPFYDLEIIQEPSSHITSNVTIRLHQQDVMRYEAVDIIVFDLLHLSPKKSIVEYFIKSPVNIPNPCSLLMRDKYGTTEIREMGISTVQKVNNVHGDGSSIITLCYSTEPFIPTIAGDCGSVLVSITNFGVVILGLHISGSTIGSRNISSATYVSLSLVQTIVGTYNKPLIGDNILTSPCQTKPLKVVNLHHKSPFRYIEDGIATIVGSLDEPRIKHTSRVVPSRLHSVLHNTYNIQKKREKPKLNGWQLWRENLLPMLEYNGKIKSYRVKNIVNHMIEEFSQLLDINDDGWKDRLHVIDYMTAINGAPGVAHIDKLKRNTSMGYPWNCSKKLYMLDLPAYDGWSNPVDFTQDIKLAIEEMLNTYYKGQRCNPIFMATPKDKAIKPGKLPRLFTASPAHFSVVGKMLFATIVRTIMRNKYIFEQAPGMNCMSKDWTELALGLKTFNNYFAGDYKNYDKKLTGLLIIEAFRLIITLASRGKYKAQDIIAMWAYAYDVAFYWCNFNGDLVTFLQGLPSGNVLTVVINSLINSILHRYAWVSLGLNVETFRKHVFLMCYGDDSIGSTDEPRFNHILLNKCFEEIGITYTMADKSDNIIPFIEFSEVTFLKRYFVFEESLQLYLAPLEVDSIEQSLMYVIPSKAITEIEQLTSILVSLSYEAYFHGAIKYEYYINMILTCCQYLKIPMINYKPYATMSEELKESIASDTHACIKKKYLSYTPDYNINKSEFMSSHCSIVSCPIANTENGLIEGETLCSSQSLYLQAHLGFSAYERTNPCYTELVSIGDTQRLTQSNLQETTEGSRSLNQPTNKKRNQAKISVTPTEAKISKVPFTKKDINYLYNHINKLRYIRRSNSRNLKEIRLSTQSGLTDTEQLQYVTSSQGEVTTSVPRGSTLSTNDTIPHDLSGYLSRPVRVQTMTWSSSTPAATAINTPIYPLANYLNNAAIKNKILNFSWISCKMRIKILVNSTPFNYGYARATYVPFYNFSQLDLSGTAPGLITDSQVPGCFIEPHNQKGGEILIPYHGPSNMLPLGDLTDLQDYGRLTIIVYVPLRSANGIGSVDCSIEVFVSLEDVVLTAPTIHSTLQSGIVDEYDKKGTGAISKPASTIATAASYLTKIPIIGPFARATEIGASSISRIAQLFGYTNVPNLKSIDPIQIRSCPRLAATDDSFPIEPLSVDPKQELAISKKQLGFNDEDELIINNIAKKVSYVTSIDWTSGANVDDQLWWSCVTPLIYDSVSYDTVNTAVYMTPVAFASYPFTYWRGDLIYTFKFIKTPYHRGRVRITYDPYVDSSDAGPQVTSDTFTTLEGVVYDMSVGDQIDVRVPYSSWKSWLEVQTNQASSSMAASAIPFYPNSNTSTPVPDRSLHNGVLSLRVLNTLEGPATTNTISIIVMVRAAENFEVAAPRELDNPNDTGSDAPVLRTLPMQSGLINSSDADNCGITSVTLGRATTCPLEANTIYMGETIISFRQLLQRFNMVERRVISQSTGDSIQIMRRNYHQLPLMPGFTTGIGDTATGTINSAYSAAQMTLVNYLSIAFMGYRGSVNYLVTISKSKKPISIKAKRVNSGNYNMAFSNTVYTTNDMVTSRIMIQKMLGSCAGSALTTSVNNALAITIPFQQGNKFVLRDQGLPNVLVNTSITRAMQFTGCTYEATWSSNPDQGRAVWDTYWSAGPDFDLIWFLGVPVLFRQNYPT